MPLALSLRRLRCGPRPTPHELHEHAVTARRRSAPVRLGSGSRSVPARAHRLAARNEACAPAGRGLAAGRSPPARALRRVRPPAPTVPTRAPTRAAAGGGRCAARRELIGLVTQQRHCPRSTVPGPATVAPAPCGPPGARSVPGRRSNSVTTLSSAGRAELYRPASDSSRASTRRSIGNAAASPLSADDSN